jgi:hypothetical protein
MADELSRDAARAWFADRMGRMVTATLAEDTRLVTSDRGPLRTYGDGYRVGEIAFVGFDDPKLSIVYELRYDDPDVDRLVAIANGVVEIAFRCDDEDRPPRVWNAADFG